MKSLLGMGIILVALCGWVYDLNVEQADFRAQAAASNVTFSANYSDLYPRWRGAYELLWHGRDPYSAEVTAAIHEGLTGQPPPPGDPLVLADAFAYPLYFVVVLAPLTLFSYSVLMPWLYLGALILVALGIWGWVRALGGIAGLPAALVVVLGCSSLPAIGAIVQQQPVVFSVACLAGAAAALSQGAKAAHYERWYLLAGGGLALATIKPQCCLLLLPAIVIWVLGGVQQRRGVMLGFVGVLGGLVLAAEALLPGWIPEWLAALRDYQQAVSLTPLLLAVLPSMIAPVVLAVGGLVLVLIIWRLRQAAADQLGFQLMLALPLVISYLVFPSWSYQQLLLYPAVLLVLSQQALFRSYGARGRSLYATMVGLIVWPFLVTVVGAGIWGSAMLQQQAAPYLPAEVVKPAIWLPLIVLPFALLLVLGWMAWQIARAPTRRAVDIPRLNPQHNL